VASAFRVEIQVDEPRSKDFCWGLWLASRVDHVLSDGNGLDDFFVSIIKTCSPSVYFLLAGGEEIFLGWGVWGWAFH
jgi:hypothetical protein